MTRSLAAFERFFERLLEVPSARLFRTTLQPVQLQVRLERAMEGGRMRSGDRTYVPDRYRVLLNPADAEGFQDDRTMLQADLAEAVLQRARVRGYRLITRPEVVLIPSAEVAAGDIRVVADALDQGLVRSAAAGLRAVELEGPRPPRPPIPETAAVPAPSAVTDGGAVPATRGRLDGAAFPGSVPAAERTIGGQGGTPASEPHEPWPGASGASFEPHEPPSAAADLALTPFAPNEPTIPPFAMVDPVAPFVPGDPASPLPERAAPRRIAAVIEVRSRTDAPWAHVFSGGVVRIGRGLDNEIVLPDDRVSRHHAQLTARQGTLVLTDLGSSNGSFVNGARVREIALGLGDVVRLGNTTLTVRPGP